AALPVVVHCGSTPAPSSNAVDGSVVDAAPIADANVDAPTDAASAVGDDGTTSDAGGDGTLADAFVDALEEASEAGDAADAPTEMSIQLTDDGSCPQEIARFFYGDAGAC